MNTQHTDSVEETIAKHFTSIGMVHLNAFCKLLKSQHSKGKDVMYTVRRTEQYPFIFETKADVAKEVGKYIQSDLDQPISQSHQEAGVDHALKVSKAIQQH